MRLNSLNSLFVFNLPSDFIPTSHVDRYNSIMDKNWIQYETAIDYLNSTIKEINIPGLSIETPEQNIRHGKRVRHKPATVSQDILTSAEIDIIFRSVDSDLNWFILFDLFKTHYIDTDHKYVNPFIVTSLDVNRDAIFEVKYREIILKSLSDNRLMYQSNRIQEKTFTVTFTYNYYEIDYLLNPNKVLDVTDPWIPKIERKFN